jgi:hypothetical protein
MTFYCWFRELIRVHLLNHPSLIPLIENDSAAKEIICGAVLNLSDNQLSYCIGILKPL